jgi:acyl-CoA reductase-like NAD-dependent aldehyde dehydrogenase
VSATRHVAPFHHSQLAGRGQPRGRAPNDLDQAERVADRIDAGMVYVNIVGADGAELPFGGTKRSGFGRELGRYGADEFVNKKLIRIS